MTTFALLVAAFLSLVLLPCMLGNLLLNLRRSSGVPPSPLPAALRMRELA